MTAVATPSTDIIPTVDAVTERFTTAATDCKTQADALLRLSVLYRQVSTSLITFSGLAKNYGLGEKKSEVANSFVLCSQELKTLGERLAPYAEQDSLPLEHLRRLYAELRDLLRSCSQEHEVPTREKFSEHFARCLTIAGEAFPTPPSSAESLTALQTPATT